jgi:acetolactate synthase I/II/III large subunit
MPIVVIAALNADTTLPYSAQYWIDPGDLVREYTKWTNHFPLANHIPAEMIHAFATAEAHPQGPVLISTFANTWLDELTNGQITLPNPTKLAAGRPSVPTTESLSEVAALLVNARNPIIVAGDSGRRDAAFNETVKLAELVGAGVVETHAAFTSFPWNHPLHIGFSTDPIKDADVVFTLEAGAPAVPAACKLVSLDVDPIRSHALASSGRLRETDVRLLGETSDTLSALIKTIGTPSAGLETAAAARTAKWRDYGARLRAEWRATAARHLNDSPISEWRLADEINKIMSDKTLLFGWSYHSRSRVVYPGIATNYPKSYIYTLGGSHLGQTLYGAIGAACARPDKQVIAVCGDLEWHMGHGAAALWSAAHHSIPVLYIVVNNHEMSTTKVGQMQQKGEGAQLNNWWAQELTQPMADYSTHAKGLGIYGECVKEPDQAGPALKRALDAIASDKKPAILDVWAPSIVNVDGLP